MKILIIYPTLTHPVNAGNKQWVLSQASILRELGNDVYMLCINTPGLKDSQDSIKKAIRETCEFWGNHGFVLSSSLFERVKATFVMHFRRLFFKGYYKCDDLYPPRLHVYVKRLNEHYHFDACIVNYYWLTKVLKKTNIPLKIVNTHDVFSFRDITTHSKRAWMSTFPNEEAKALNRADYIMALQDEEAIYFAHLAPRSKVKVVYCSFEIHKTPFVGNHALLMLAGAGALNINGLVWFINNIFPAIIKEFPDVELIIGGYICNMIGKRINHPNIRLLGAVHDPMELYKLGDVAINPVTDGTGLKIKTFEALSYGKIVMTHPHSVIGVFKKEDSNIFYSEDAEKWVSYLKKLWNDLNIIESLKCKSIDYIIEMNSFIEMNYKSLMNSL